jgi:hypothetical protein
MLDAFDEGWKNLGEEGRTVWLNRVKANPYAARPHGYYDRDLSRYPRQFTPYMFTSWPAALEDVCRELMTTLPYSRIDIDRTTDVRNAVESVLLRSNAAIFNLPPMPDCETDRSYQEDLRRVRFAVASHVAVKITETEMTKVLERIQKRLAEKGGFQSILEEYTPDFTWLKEESEGQIIVAEGSGSGSVKL